MVRIFDALNILFFKKEHCKELQFGLDYNLRDRFPRKLGNTTVATYISENTHRPNAELHESIVQVAARMKADINRGIQNQEPFMLKALIDLYIKDEKMFRPPEQNHCSKLLDYFDILKVFKRLECELFERRKI